MAELPGLPATGPVTLAAVKAELSYTSVDAARDARLQIRVDAVNSWVRQLPVAADSLTYGAPPPAWPAYITLGSLMLATRLWRRKDSPSGVEAFTDGSAFYVQRNDPDVARMLKLTLPMVG